MKTLEEATHLVSNIYSVQPTLKETRNPFRVALKVYNLIPNNIQEKHQLKKELDAYIAPQCYSAPETWRDLWSDIAILLEKHIGQYKTEWNEKIVLTFNAKQTIDEEDYT
jgi:hypothetical protein